MTPSDTIQTEGSCCHRSIIQFGEIKRELRNIRQTVDIAVQLLSKLVGLTPDDIQTLACSSDVKTCTLAVDGLSVISNASDSALGRDTAKISMYVPLNQTAVVEGVSAKVNTMVEVENGQPTNKINVEENEETEAEAESSESTVEAESNHVVEVKNDKTVPKTKNDKDSSVGKIDKSSQVNSSTTPFSSPSERLTTFLKTNSLNFPLSESSVVITAKDCGSILGDSVMPVVADSDVLVQTVQLDPRHKQADSNIQGEAGSCDRALLNMMPAVSVCTDVVVAEMVSTDFEVGLSSVRVKEEEISGYGDTDLSVFDSSGDRLPEPQGVKLEHEGVFISDSMLPICILVKKEDGLCISNAQENSAVTHASSNSTERWNGENSVVNTGSNECNNEQENGHMVQDSPYKETSSLHTLLGSSLVSKLKQKIQEKIQATVHAVDEEKTVIEDGSSNFTNAKKTVEILHPFRKDCKTLKNLTLSQNKLRQKFYQCRMCAKIFFYKMALCVHKNDCRGLQKQYHCSFCPLMFKSRTVLFNHKQLHSAKKSKGRHKCEVCGRVFILKSSLKKHRQSQACKGARLKCYRKLPQYFCAECGEGFLNSYNLELHQKLHKVGKTHSISSVAGKTGIGNRSGSAVVSRTARRYPCSYCHEAFIDRRSVALHEKLHTDKEFATFDQERKMIQRRHHLTMMLQKQQQGNRKKFACDVCGRCYSIELLLHMHTRLHHAIS